MNGWNGCRHCCVRTITDQPFLVPWRSPGEKALECDTSTHNSPCCCECALQVQGAMLRIQRLLHLALASNGTDRTLAGGWRSRWCEVAPLDIRERWNLRLLRWSAHPGCLFTLADQFLACISGSDESAGTKCENSCGHLALKVHQLTSILVVAERACCRQLQA